MKADPLLEVKKLRLSVRGDEGVAQILDHVELALARGEILGVVGESGCGKSTLARAVLGIFAKAATIESGEINFEGEDLLRLSDREMTRRVRGRRIGFIPQDPYLALNPVFKIGAQLLAAMRWHAPPQLKTEACAPRRADRLAAPRAAARARGHAGALSAPIFRGTAPAPDDRRRACRAAGLTHCR